MAMQRSKTEDHWKVFDKVRLDRDCPLLRQALDDWCDLLRDCELDVATAVGASSGTALLRARPALRDWFEAHWLHGDDLAAANDQMGLRSWLAAGHSPAVWIDLFLVPEWLLAMSRFSFAGHAVPATVRRGLAAVTAVECARGLIDAQVPPEAVRERGCWIRPAIARDLIAGRYVCSRVGESEAIAALAGQAPIEGALDGDDLAEIAALAAGHHAASALRAPQQAGLDEVQAVWVEDALLALVQRRVRSAGTARALELPPAGGLRIDFSQALLCTVEPPPSVVQAAALGLIDPQVTQLPLPIGPCARALAFGWRSLSIDLAHLDDLDDLVSALLDALDDPPTGTAEVLTGEGFALHWVR